MNAESSNWKTLVAVDQLPMSERDEVVCQRLEEQLGGEIQTCQIQDLTETDLKGQNLVVSCARRATAGLRDAKIPVIALNVSSLYDLGMTRARKNEDFGVEKNGSTRSQNTLVSHPLGTVVKERITTKEKKTNMGWAKPSDDAVILLSLDGIPEKAVVFSYERGVEMPGLQAPHRRAACLLGEDDLSALTREGWLLFDDSVEWALQGGSPKMKAPSIRDTVGGSGDTRQLSDKELNEWRDEVIAKRVWSKLLWPLSVGGIGGLLTLVLVVWGAITFVAKQEARDASSEMNEKFTAKFSLIADRLRDEVKDDIAGSIAKTLVDQKELKENLEDIAKDIVKELLEDKGIENKVVQLSLETIRDKTSDNRHRHTALRMLQVFGTEKEIEENVNLAIRGLLLDDAVYAENIELLFEAINSYHPHKQHYMVDNLILNKLLTSVKGDQHRSSTDENGSSTTVRYEEMLSSYNQVFSKYSKEFASTFGHWVTVNATQPGSTLAVERMIQMGCDESLEQFTEMASEDDNLELQDFGLYGLAKLRAESDFDPVLRHKALRVIIEINKKNLETERGNKLPPRLENHAGDLYIAMRNFDNQKLRKLRTESKQLSNTRLSSLYDNIFNDHKLDELRQQFTSQANLIDYLTKKSDHIRDLPEIVNLIRSDDWELFIKEFVTIENKSNTDRQVVDLLLFNWAERLEKDGIGNETNELITGPVLDAILDLDDPINQPGSTRVVELAIRNENGAAKFLKKFSSLYRSPKVDSYPVKRDPAGRTLISKAIKLDEKNEFKNTLDLLGQIATDEQPELVATIARELSPATSNDEVREFLLDVIKQPVIDKESLNAARSALDALSAITTDKIKPVSKNLINRLVAVRDSSSIGNAENATIFVESILRVLNRYWMALDHDAEFLELIESKTSVASSASQSPASKQIITFLASKYEYLGYLRHENEEYEDAVEAFSFAINLDPDNLRVLTRRAKTYEEQNADFNKIIADLNTAVERSKNKPSNGQHLRSRKSFYVRTGKYAQAINDLSTLIGLEPNWAQHVVDRGFTYLRSAAKVRESGTNDESVEQFNKDLDSAIKDFETANKLSGGDGDPNALRGLGLAITLKGDPEQEQRVKAITDQGVRLCWTDRDKAGSQENLGLLYLRLARNQTEGSEEEKAFWTKAKENTERVIKFDKKMAWNWLIRGIATSYLEEAINSEDAFSMFHQYAVKKDVEDLELYIPDEIEEFKEKIKRESLPEKR